MRRKRIGILTGGGDVQPLNAVLAAAADYARHNSLHLIGFSNGWQGLLERNFVDLSRIRIDEMIGGTYLRSSRANLAKIAGGEDAVRSTVRSLGLDGLIVVGGEDTLSNSFRLPDLLQVLITKTIDNDVGALEWNGGRSAGGTFTNYFTLGHPTAARKISSFVSWQEGLRTTAYSHERIVIVESMGMHAGWLALSACMGTPDIILIPEFPISFSRLAERVAECFRKQRHVIVVIAEGARWEDGSYVSADESSNDMFDHPRFIGAASALASRLKPVAKSYCDPRNINAVNPSYLYRSGAPCTLDRACARLLATRAMMLLKKGVEDSGFLVLKMHRGKYSTGFETVQAVENMNRFHRFIDGHLYDETNFRATRDALKYWRTFVPEFPILQYGK
jgi:6-phosphofructokinase